MRLLETMESLDAEAFAAHFGADTTWTAVLSDGSTCPLGDGSTRPLDGGDGGDGGDGDRTVTYAERHAYALCLQRARMSECDSQVTRQLELQINRVIIAINAINFFSRLTRLHFLIAMKKKNSIFIFQLTVFGSSGLF